MLSSTLLDLARAAERLRAGWALIGGQALIMHGVPRDTLDADALVEPEELEHLAAVLVDDFRWTPTVYDTETDDFVDAEEIMVHYMQDPVLFDLHEERRMIPLRSPMGLPVDLLSAQHPVERAMIESAGLAMYEGVKIPVAPLGGVLLVKTKADRPKDIAAIEQAAEHLTAATVRSAIEWARRQDPATAEDMAALIGTARARRAPSRTETVKRRK